MSKKQSLYTKYRPTNFDGVIGQKVAKDRTTLNITHRLSSLQFADKIMIFENGKITAFDSENEIIENKYFQTLMSIQTEHLS